MFEEISSSCLWHVVDSAAVESLAGVRELAETWPDAMVVVCSINGQCFCFVCFDSFRGIRAVQCSQIIPLHAHQMISRLMFEPCPTVRTIALPGNRLARELNNYPLGRYLLLQSRYLPIQGNKKLFPGKCSIPEQIDSQAERSLEQCICRAHLWNSPSWPQGDVKFFLKFVNLSCTREVSCP